MQRKSTHLPSRREEELMMILINGERYGLELLDEYERRAKRKLPPGTLYTTLDRMEGKKLVKSRYGKTSPGRGGNRRRYYALTSIGRNILRDMEVRMDQLSLGAI